MKKMFLLLVLCLLVLGCSVPYDKQEVEYVYEPNTIGDSRSTLGLPGTASTKPYYCEGERYTTKINGRYSTISYDYKPAASNLCTVHFGSNSSNIYYGVGDTVTYSIPFSIVFMDARLQIRFSDDVAGNIVNVYLDNVYKGSFTTYDTGTWNSFAWHTTTIGLGTIGAGTHTLKFYVNKGGSYGFNLDQIKIY